VGSIDPEVGAMFAAQIPQNIVLINAEMLLADNFSTEIDRTRQRVIPFFVDFFFPAEDGGCISGQQILGVDVFIVGLASPNDQFEIESERMIGQFMFCIYDLVGNVFCVGDVPEGKSFGLGE
jgi:hypothetical protein